MRQSILVIAAIAILLGIAGYLYWKSFPGPNPDQPGTITLSDAEKAEAAAKFQQGLGYLENLEYEQAAPLLEKLAEQLPDSPGIQRNLALNYLLGIESLTGVSDDIRVARRLELIGLMQQALDRLHTFEGEQTTWGLFSARLAKAKGDEANVVKFLQEAIQASPGEAAFPYELYDVCQNSQDESMRSLALSALEKAHASRPDNIWVLGEMLFRQAEAESPNLVKTLQSSQATLEIARAPIMEHNRTDVFDLIQQAQQAVESNNGAVATRSLRILLNVLRPEDVAQSDKIRLEKHPLEYVSITLPAELQASAAATSGTEAKAAFQFTSAELPAEMKAGARAIAVGDFDLDQLDDICVLRDDSVMIYGREALASDWKPIATLSVPAGFSHVLAADLDADEREANRTTQIDLPAAVKCRRADMDFVLYGASGVLLLQNKLDQETGTRSLLEMPLNSQLQNITIATAVDCDMDGDLDLLFGSAGRIEQWSNQNQWKFGLQAASPASVPQDFTPRQFIPVDIDRDVDLDVIVTGENKQCALLENLRHGLFRYQPLEVDGQPLTASSLAVTDYNGDGTWDLLAADETSLTLFQGIAAANGKLTLQKKTALSGGGQDLQVADFDNDATEDALLAGPAVSLLRLTSGSESAVAALQSRDPGTNVEICDFDSDGDLDLLGIEGSEVRLLLNETQGQGNWAQFALVAEEFDPSSDNAISSKRINHFAIGSTVEVRTGASLLMRVVNGPHVYFGLGGREQVDTVRIIWPNGIPQHHVQPPVRALLCESQVVGGSCPYLYACTSDGVHFVTDLLWAAPLGLPSADGSLVPDRPWENLRIPGELLEPVNGRYRLHLTEELREAAYFDRVQLFAVDHPADVSVFTNEKVGPPQLAEHRLHTVKNLMSPLAATNQHGRDLLDELGQVDDLYARPYDELLAHGLTEPTTIELRLDPAQIPTDGPLDVRLFMTGWLHAPDAGVTTAIHEHLEAGGNDFSIPQPLSMWIPDESGQWQEAIPFTGFVGGKTKTIVLSAGDALNRKDPRIQLRSSMEFAWDQIGYTVNEADIPVSEVELKLVAANLHYRGVSRRVEHQHFGPDRFDHSQVTEYAGYNLMSGRFTRYGDVLPLLTAADNQMVIEGTGDELTLEFEALPPPPAGWKRDFVIRNVGWDKDAQMQVIYGQSSEPLPYHGMPSYPYLEGPPDSPEYRAYLKTYQTRELPRGAFRRTVAR